MAEVVLVSMPFGPVFAPSLGLSLLKAGLARHGVEAALHYFTISFAEVIGQDFYCGIADGDRPALEDMAGEWLFSRVLFETAPADDARYVEELLRGYYSEALIARVLRARDHIDPFLDGCLETILAEEPKVVGFTSIFQQHVASLALARRLKEARPSTFVVLGGANCEGVMGAETVRSFTFIDAAVSGEADLVFPELVRRVLHGEPISRLPGVRSRESVEADFAAGSFGNAPTVSQMDCLPYPDYSDYFQQFRASRFDRDWQPGVFFETSRGCWWGERMHCTFCGLNGSTMAFRSKSAGRALAELTDLVRRYPDSDVQVVDNILDLRYFKDFVPALARSRLKVRLFYETKANLTKYQVRLLRDAGILEVQPGIESLSDAVLKLMRKGVTGLQNIQLLKWCKELGVQASWNFIWGFPGEPPAEYQRLARLVPLLTHLPPPTGYDSIRLDRFSPNFFDADRMGFRDVRPLPAYKHFYRLPEAAVANLACYFTYQYREPRNVDDYARPLAREIEKWKIPRYQGELLLFDDGGHLVIVDLRPASRTPFVVVGGLLRTLYRECDCVRDLWHLEKSVGREPGNEAPSIPLERALAPLVEHGLLLREGSRYLSLAIPIGDYAPPPSVGRKFTDIVRTVGTPCTRGWILPVTQIGCTNDGNPRRVDLMPRRGSRAARVPPLNACRFSVDARGRLVIQASERPRQRRRSR